MCTLYGVLVNTQNYQRFQIVRRITSLKIHLALLLYNAQCAPFMYMFSSFLVIHDWMKLKISGNYCFPGMIFIRKQYINLHTGFEEINC